MKNWLIAGIVVVIAIGGAVVFAQSQRTANIEVRVWEDVNDPERNYISARPEGGSWRTLGTIPLPLTDGVSSSGRFRYGDITLAVPLPEEAAVPSATPTPSPTATPTPTPTPSATPTPTPRLAPAHAQFGDWRREEVRDNSNIDNPNRLTHIWYVLAHAEVDNIVGGALESMTLALGCSGLNRPTPGFETEIRGAEGYQRIISTFPGTYPGGTALYSRRLATELLTDSDRIVTITVMSGPIEVAVFTFDVTGIDAVLDDLSCY